MYSKFVFSQNEQQLWFLIGSFFLGDGNAVLGYYDLSNGNEQYYDLNDRSIFFMFNELFFLNDNSLVMTSFDDFDIEGFYAVSYVMNVTDLYDDNQDVNNVFRVNNFTTMSNTIPWI